MIQPVDPIHQVGGGKPLSRQDIKKIVAETIAKFMPSMLSNVLAAGEPRPSVPSNDIRPRETGTPDTEDQQSSTTQSSRAERFYAPEKRAQLSAELLVLTTQAFAKSLSRETWKGFIENYLNLEGTESFLAAPITEANMKEDVRKKHGYNQGCL